MQKKFILLNLAAFAAVLLVNFLANALPIAGRTPGEVSDLFPTLFTPAGFTFAIWSVIYLSLLGFAIYQARFWAKPSPAFLTQIGWLFVMSCAANIAWLLAFHHLRIELSMLIMLVLAGSLLGIYLRLGIGKKAVETAAEQWLVRLPFSLYLGWVTVATIANASILLTHLGWNGEPPNPQFWTVAVLATAVGIGLWALASRRDFAFALVILWALFGIFSKRNADVLTQDSLVQVAAIAGMVMLSVAILYRLIAGRSTV